MFKLKQTSKIKRKESERIDRNEKNVVIACWFCQTNTMLHFENLHKEIPASQRRTKIRRLLTIFSNFKDLFNNFCKCVVTFETIEYFICFKYVVITCLFLQAMSILEF